MCEFRYKYIKSKYDANLLFPDTDVYEDFYKDKYLFGFSDYPLHSKFFDPVNKKVIGKMKDEFKGKIINEFVGLLSKMYSLIAVDDEEVKKAKHKEFVDVLFNKKITRHKMNRIKSKLHKIGTYNFIVLFFDDKRYILNYGINSLAYFHKDIRANKIG